jgi:[ribosomal protein S5]-alanine N-acetyltransferase
MTFPISFKPIEKDSLLINSFTEDDISDEYISWLNDPIIVKYSNQKFLNHNIKSCKDYLNSFENSSNLFLKIINKEHDNNTMLGTLTVYINQYHQTADIGIMIGHKESWGKGIGKKAWMIILEWLRKSGEIRKITAGTMSCNIGMMKIIESSGMSLEATRYQQELLDGLPQDLKYFSFFI